MVSLSFRASFELQPLDKFIHVFNQKLEMSSDAIRSLLCKNIIISFYILSSTTCLPIWSSRPNCTTTLSNIPVMLPPKLWDVHSSMLSNFMQKPILVLWKI